MAEVESDDIEAALETIVSATGESKHLKKQLKETILESVSTIRKIFHELNKRVDELNSENSQLQSQVRISREQEEREDTSIARQVAPSISGNRRQGATAQRREPPGESNKNSYADVVRNKKKENKFKIMVKTRINHSPETIKNILKTKINPIEIKVGISSLKTLKDGRVLIETCSKDEAEKISASITEKCGENWRLKLSNSDNLD